MAKLFTEFLMKHRKSFYFFYNWKSRHARLTATTRHIDTRKRTTKRLSLDLKINSRLKAI